MPKVNYEERFYVALKRITAYMTVTQLRRAAERQYGLDHAEVLEMAYENVIGEAKHALRGYRKPRDTKGGRVEVPKSPDGATRALAGDLQSRP